ncbi:MAG: formate dehydrogenase subunit gamma [Hyphomicrobium sp.]
MKTYERWSDEKTSSIVASHLHLEGPLLPILHAAQEAFGFIPEEAIPVIAKDLNLSRAEVHGVVSFYHDFRRETCGRHVVKICRAEACQSMGCEPLVAHAEKKLGVPCGETSADGRVTLEAVYCLGLCATAPSAMVDGKIIGRLNAARLDQILKEAGA